VYQHIWAQLFIYINVLFFINFSQSIKSPRIRRKKRKRRKDILTVRMIVVVKKKEIIYQLIKN